MKPLSNTGKQQDPKDFDQFSDLLSFAYSPAQQSSAFLKFIGVFIFNILRLACVPAELIFRRRFGERHFNLYLYIGGTLWLGIFAFGWLNIPAAFGIRHEGIVPNGLIFTVVAIVFYGRMIWELFIRKSKKINVDLYSYHDGDTYTILDRFPFAKDKQGNINDYAIRQLIEPAVMFILGVVCAVILNPETGSWLIISSFCMAVKEYVKARHTRDLMLDQIDADIMGRNIAEAMRGSPVRDTQGVYVSGVSSEGKDRAYLRELAEKNHKVFTADSAE